MNEAELRTLAVKTASLSNITNDSLLVPVNNPDMVLLY